MKVKKVILVSVVCGMTSLVAIGPAHASAYATSVLSLTKTKLTVGDGTSGVLGADVAIGDFSAIIATNTGAATATLNGSFSTDSSTQSIFDPSAGEINLTNQWVGVDSLGDDNYVAIAPPATSTYANSDSDLSGSIIDLDNGGPAVAGSAAQTRADVSMDTLGDGNSQSNLQLSSTSVFTVNSSLTAGFTLSFDYLAYLAVELTNNEPIPGSVNANLSWQAVLSVLNGPEVSSFNPAELNLLGSFDAPFNGTFIDGGTGSLSWFSGILTQGVTYKLVIQHDTNAAARSAVPEPNALFLLGLGFGLLAFFSQQRERKVVDISSLSA